jgi:hypothetical protein
MYVRWLRAVAKYCSSEVKYVPRLYAYCAHGPDSTSRFYFIFLSFDTYCSSLEFNCHSTASYVIGKFILFVCKLFQIV